MPITPQEFVSKWKRVTSREKQTVQEHFIDLCHLAGHQTPNEADPTGMRFAFEMGAAKTSGGQGWADVAKLGYFGWEYKGKDDDLDKAYSQLLRYRDSLNNPPLLIVSDINQIVIRTNYTKLPTRTFTLSLDDLIKPESISILKTVFFNPEQLKPQVTIESVTKEAAQELVEQRDRWLNAEGPNEAEKKKRTLTNSYNQRPTWLDLAHKKLDQAVFAAYGWKHDLSDEEILENLLRLKLAR